MIRVRPNVLKMKPYSPGKPISEVQRDLGLAKVIKLASNENPLGPSPKAVAAIKEAASSLHLYPDAGSYELRHALAAKHGISAGQVLVGNGSDEIIHLLGLVFLAEGDNIVIAEPTFVRYEAAGFLAEAEIRRVPLDGNLVHDLPAMAAACDAATKLVFVANPHNPTGTVVGREALAKFLDSLPSGTVAILDEAYYEYACDDPAFPSGLDFVKAGKPVISLRTFSKAYGLAGIRIGYGFADAAIVDAVDRAREPFHVNALAQAAAVAALGDEEHLAASRDVNRRGAARIASEMERLGYRVIPTSANFIAIDIRQPAGPVFQSLLREGVIIRSGEPLGLPTFLRVTIGTEEEVEEFLRAFRKVCARASA